jgi:heme oxygenase
MSLAAPPPFLPRSALLARLERETNAYHSVAEADLFGILDDPTPDKFRLFLAAIFHFEQAVELRLEFVDELPPELVARSAKTSRLHDDLIALGHHPSVLQLLAHPLQLPPIDSVHEALGWIYVLQRNTLRHGALLRALAPRLRAALRLASRYLTTHAGDVYERWHELGTVLDRAVDDDAAAGQRVITAARDAFERQHLWYAATIRRAPGGPRAYAAR